MSCEETDEIFVHDLTAEEFKLIILSNPPVTDSTEGAIFVSDGTGGLTAGDPYFVPASNGAPVNMLVGTGIPGAGPVTDNAIVRWDGASGLSVQNSGVLLDDSQNFTGVNTIEFETGANDLTLDAATQTVSSATATLPDLGGTGGDIVINNLSQTLTNKSITGSTNTVHASHLQTTGAAVNVSAAAPPIVNQVLRTTSATTATWQTVGTTVATYQLVGPKAEATSTTFTAIGYFPWLDSRYSGYSSGIVVLRATIGNRNLIIRLRDVTNGATLGSATVSSTGSTSFAVSNPSADAQVELQVHKSAPGGVNPQIFGVVLEFTT